jgi:hypothetical protein
VLRTEEGTLNSSLIGKIDKAKRYARERDRFRIDGVHVLVKGDNDSHEVNLANGRWSCSCDFFGGWGVCSHTMAIERVFDGMLPREAIGQEYATAR